MHLYLAHRCILRTKEKNYNSNSGFRFSGYKKKRKGDGKLLLFILNNDALLFSQNAGSDIMPDGFSRRKTT